MSDFEDDISFYLNTGKWKTRRREKSLTDFYWFLRGVYYCDMCGNYQCFDEGSLLGADS